MKIRRAGALGLYTLGSIRYGSLVIPAALVAYIMGLPEWLVMSSLVLLVLAVAAEIFTSVVHGVNQMQEADMVRQVYADIEEYANGSEQAQQADEEGGEAGIR